MSKNTKKYDGVKEFLLTLADGYIELTKIGMHPGRLWYWDYYQSLEQEIKDAKLRRKIYQQIYHLERFGFIDKRGLTAKALAKIRKLRSKETVNKPLKWDGRWRIVIFDIPEKKRIARDNLRLFLKDLGFKMLQNSNWLCPYGDFDEIQDFIKEQGIEKYVVLIISEKISNELLFKTKFKLL